MNSVNRALNAKSAPQSWRSWIRMGFRLLSGERAHKSTAALVDQAVVSATNFLTGVIIGRTLAKEDFGLYMLGFSIVLFVINIQSSIISTPYTIYSPRLKDFEKIRYAGSTLIHQLGLSFFTIVSLFFASLLLSSGIGPRGLDAVVWTLVLTITFILFREFARQVSFAHMQIKRALLLDVFVAVIQIGGLIIIAYLGALSVSRAYWVVGLACGLVAVVWLVSTRKDFTLRLRGTVLDLVRNWSFGKWLIAGSLTYTLSMQTYPWLLATFHGTGATGILAACSGVLFLANPFLLGMGNFLGPETARAMANGGVKEVSRVVAEYTLIFALIMGLFSALMVIFGGFVVTLIYGEKYAGNGLVVGLLALSQLASALTFPLNLGLSAMERADVAFKSYVLSLGVTLLLGIWLTKSFGLVGVAFSLLCGDVIASTFRWLAFRKQVNAFSVEERKLTQ